MWSLLLLTTLVASADDAPSLPEAEPTAQEAAPASVDELLTEARKRVVRGDWEGVRILADRALAMASDAPDQRAARYLIAVATEHTGDREAALSDYDQLLREDGDNVHVKFRRAETLAQLGRAAEARAQLAELGDPAQWPPADRAKLEILTALLEIEAARKPRKPLVALRDALDRAGPDDAPEYQARGRCALVEMAASQAEAISFKGSKRKKKKQLEARAELIALASDQTLAIVRLQIPEYVLRSLLALGDAHAQLADAIGGESQVKRLTPDQLHIYETERASRIEILRVKAVRYYERGIQYATAVQIEGPLVDALHDAHTDMIARIESAG